MPSSLLKRVSLSNLNLNADTLTSFLHCQSLVDVEYATVFVVPLSAEEHAVLWPYFQRLRAFRFAGDVETLLTAHFPQKELDLTTLQATHLSPERCQPQAISQFLRFCPQLTELALWECRVPLESTVHVICSELRLLERLHLHSNLYDSGIMPMMSPPSECLQTLWISSDDMISDNDLDALLRLTAVHVRELKVSIRYFRAKEVWIDIIARRVPNLRSLTLDYDRAQGRLFSLKKVQSVFGYLPRLVVNSWICWDRWRDFVGKTVVFDVSHH